MKTNAFSTTTSDSIISARVYNFVMAAVLLYGFAINWWMVANIPVASIMQVNQWVFIIGYLVSCFFGCYLFSSSTSPIISFIGYNFVVVPFGMVINVVLAKYSAASIESAIQTTTIVTFGMIVMGTLFPNFFKNIVGGLLIGTIVAIVCELGLIMFTGKSSHIIDWIVAILFCGWIGYDWARASELPKTVDNAIDSAANLYMSIINLFLRLLSANSDD